MWITCEYKDISAPPTRWDKDNQDMSSKNETRIVTIHKNGSSNGVVIAPPFLRALNAKRGDQLVMWLDVKKNLVMRKMSLESYQALRR